MRSLKGLLTVFYSPAETFASAGPRSWLVPIIAVALLSLAVNVMTIGVMGIGTITRNQIESNHKLAERLGPDKVNEIVHDAENSKSRTIIAYVSSLIVPPVVLLIVAAITYGILLMVGGTTTFYASLGATAWSTYCVLLITAIGTAIFLATVKDFSGVDTQNMVMLNASLFLDPQSSPGWQRSLASGIDLLAFYALFIKAVGLNRLSERVSVKQAMFAVIAMYLVWIFGKTGFSAIFS